MELLIESTHHYLESLYCVQVVDRAIVTEEWLVNMCKGRKVPIKALLLDQANISGIGNWVG